ncbi:hypothetical protein A3860_14265 [Niastella vici]|uniref:Glycosyltransferase RgtA/B/C/D-like domain-containing protein n=1 Tax=Niastella vici TaxID=1703345 RepID=A0A1V9G537_9BACT|nr:hypothetical protein [Niastella vici]OQP65759.1 hypothetical protein A3860_14265 [Niastella vici]
MIPKTGFDKITAGLFAIGAFFGLYFQLSYHKFLNNDTLAYINIAELYATGDFQHAINGYWSPLYSWVLCFCKMAGLPLLPCCYVINFLSAGFGLYILCKLARRYLTHPIFYRAFCLYALLLMLFYAMSTLTPDLTATVFCLSFLLLITDDRFTFNKKIPGLAGAVAACAYFSKSYNFGVVHLFLAFLMLLELAKKNGSRSKLIIPVIKTYGSFIILSFVWIATLSIHEHNLTFSTAGRLNYNLTNPNYGKGFPTNEDLFPPPFENAYSAHTDPAHLLDNYSWSPFRDVNSFFYQLQLVQNSIKSMINMLDSSGAKWLLIGCSLLILYFNRKKGTLLYNGSIHKIGWFFVFYPLLYLPLFILDRYILTSISLFHLLFFFIIQLAWIFINKKIFVPMVTVLLALSVVPFVLLGQRKLTRSSSEYLYYKSFYQHLPQLSFLQHQPIASDTYSMVEVTQLCYHLKCRYYSTWKDKQYESLKKYNIHFLISKKDLTPFSFLRIREKLLLNNKTVYIYEVQ